uniref:Uncharacterized protein n=1 Tax=Alexandrium catenella TaxID=2925 RepID=A0A7S1S373_ALECA
MAAFSQAQSRFPSSGRAGMTRGSLMMLAAALSQPAGVAAGGNFMEMRPQQNPEVVAHLLDMREAFPKAPDNGTFADGPAHPTHFGPDGCVGLLKSNLGTCVIRADCGKADVSKVDFSFVCLSKEAVTKQHSYGVGGFDADEVFDSGVPCDGCSTVAYAQLTGGKLVHNEVLKAGGGADDSAAAKRTLTSVEGGNRSDDRADQTGTDDQHGQKSGGGQHDGQTGGQKQFRGKGVTEDRMSTPAITRMSQEAAFFGPSACIATYLSQTGTCIIQTRCRGVDLSSFAVGVTCLDKTGDYTRYLFGKNGFDDEEIFDTTLPCKACVGVGEQPSYQLSGLVPKAIVQDLSSLKSELSSLRREVTQLKTISKSKDKKNALRPASSPAPAPSQADDSDDGGNTTNTKPAKSAGKDAKAGQQLLDASSDTGDAAGSGKLTVRDLLRRLVKQEH